MALFETYIKNNDIDWFSNTRLIVKDNIPLNIKDKIDFINNKINFYYGEDLYKNNPFLPMVVLTNGQRSVIVDDLTEDDINNLEESIQFFSHPVLLGKIYDILWILKDNHDYAMQTARTYLNYFFDNINCLELYKKLPPLKRGLYILCYLKNDDLLKEYIQQILNLSIDNVRLDKFVLAFYIADLLEQKRKKILNYFMPQFLSILNNDKGPSDITLSFIEIIIKFYKSSNDTEEIEKWRKKYVTVCEEMEKQRSPYGYEYLTKAIDILDPAIHEDLINELMIKRDESQKKLSQSIPMQNIELDTKDIDNTLNNERNKVINVFKRLNRIQQFAYLLKEINPISEEAMQKQIADYKANSIIAELFPLKVFGADNTVIYDSYKANTEEKKEYEYAQCFQFHNAFLYALLIQPYIKYSQIDDCMEGLIKDIISNNLFVPEDRKEKVVNDIIKILKGDVRLGLFDLIAQFENGCRQFLKNHEHLYPVVRHGSEYHDINLNDILVKKQKNNKFRNAICNILGDDLTLELEYLLCRPLSLNLRNRYFHDGCGSNDNCTVDEIVLAFFLIKAYCMGYDA